MENIERVTRLGDQGILLNLDTGDVDFFVHDSGSQAGDRTVKKAHITECEIVKNYVNSQLVTVNYKNISRAMRLEHYTAWLQCKLGIKPF